MDGSTVGSRSTILVASLRSQFDEAESRIMTGCDAAAVTKHSADSSPKSWLLAGNDWDEEAKTTCFPAKACVNLGRRLPLLVRTNEVTFDEDGLADEVTKRTLFVLGCCCCCCC